jgi:LysM repeat protein
MKFELKRGDTLSLLAARHGFNAQQLMMANPKIVSMDRIYEGDDIELPSTGMEDAAKKLADFWHDLWHPAG